MDYKLKIQEALDAVKELRSQYNTKAEAGETEGLEELRSQIDAKVAEARKLAEDADVEKEEAELRARAASIYTPTAKTEERESILSRTLRGVINGEQRSVEVQGPALSNFSELRTAPVKGSGGNYTDADFVTAVMTAFKENTCVFRAGARILSTNSGEQIDAPVTGTYGSALVTEGSAIAETTDNTTKSLNAYKYGAIALISRELVEDSSADIAQLVAGMLADDVTGTVNKDFLTANGSSKPEGLFVGAGAGATAGSATAVDEADIYALYYSVKDSAKVRGAWFMHPSTAADIRALSSSIWALDPGSDNPDLLLGRPVFTDSNIAEVGASAKSIAFGDPRAYMVRSVRGLRVERSDDYKFGSDLVAVRVVWRGDGVVVDPNALKVLAHPAS